MSAEAVLEPPPPNLSDRLSALDLAASPLPIAVPRLALVGAPNCGKTALFNALTGGRQKVANYAGVTVERKEGGGRLGRRVACARVLDLPGTYSLRARSPDEVVTRDAVLGRLQGEAPPDVLVCIADATNLKGGAPPGVGAEAGRPPDGAGAQHVRHRRAPGLAHRP